MARTAGGAAAALALAGCVAVPPPTVADLPAARALAEGTTLADLTHGRALYVRKCSGCHTLHAPGEYEDAAWRTHVDAMRDRARTSAADAGRIWLYLATLNGPRPARTR